MHAAATCASRCVSDHRSRKTSAFEVPSDRNEECRFYLGHFLPSKTGGSLRQIHRARHAYGDSNRKPEEDCCFHASLSTAQRFKLTGANPAQEEL